MKFKTHVLMVFSLLTIGIMGLSLFGCHNLIRSNQPAYAVASSQNAMDISGTEKYVPCPIPQTGQRRKLMSGDDGDIRAGKSWPVPRFVENGNHTVTDRLTGLMWTRNANQANGTADWEQAVSGAHSCKSGGFNDWRLPNRRELESLLDLDKANPALPKNNPFKDVKSSYYWTSTTTANSEDDAWVIQLFIGFMTNDDKAGTHYVWYVRGGM